MDGDYISTVSFTKGIGFSLVADSIIRMARSRWGTSLSSWKLDFPVRLFLNGISNGMGEWMYVETLTPLERNTLEEILSSHDELLQSKVIPREAIEQKLNDYLDWVESNEQGPAPQTLFRPMILDPYLHFSTSGQ